MILGNFPGFLGIFTLLLWMIFSTFADIKNERNYIMKKILVLSLSAVVLLGSCGTSAGDGAYVGAQFGSIIGSAIGGISGGFRGSDIGTLVGMAGGAVVGGAIGAQADKARKEEIAYEQASFDRRYRQHREAATAGSNRNTDGYRYDDDESGFDPDGRGDDTLYDFNSTDYTDNYTASEPENVVHSVRYDEIKDVSVKSGYALDIRNARFVDGNQDNMLNPDELCKLIFEVYNTSAEPLSDVQPMVVETTGNRQISVSGTIHIENINPGKGIRYTAMIKAGKRLKGDSAVFRVYAVQGNNNPVSNVIELDIPVKRK